MRSLLLTNQYQPSVLIGDWIRRTSARASMTSIREVGAAVLPF